MTTIFRTAGLLILSNVFMKQPLRLDFLWAALCLAGAVYFMFRGHVVA